MGSRKMTINQGTEFEDNGNSSIHSSQESILQNGPTNLHTGPVNIVTTEKYFKRALDANIYDVEQNNYTDEALEARDYFDGTEDQSAQLVSQGFHQLSCTEGLIKVYKKIKDKVIAHRLHVLGFILAKLSGIIFTVNNAIIQTMELDFSEVMFVRGTVQVFILTFLIISNGYSFLPYVWNDPIKVRFLTIFQGIFAGLAITCAVSCVRFMPLGDALTLLFTSPLTTMILAAIFLKHPFRLYRS